MQLTVPLTTLTLLTLVLAVDAQSRNEPAHIRRNERRQEELLRPKIARLGATATKALEMWSSTIETASDPREWFENRFWHISGNKIVDTVDVETKASKVFFPTSTEEVSLILRNTPEHVPIACVCGGHEGSNVALVAGHDAIILDFVQMKDLSFDKDTNEITIQAGVLTQQLVEFVRNCPKQLIHQ